MVECAPHSEFVSFILCLYSVVFYGVLKDSKNQPVRRVRLVTYGSSIVSVKMTVCMLNFLAYVHVSLLIILNTLNFLFTSCH
jgi:hypothetical protein